VKANNEEVPPQGAGADAPTEDPDLDQLLEADEPQSQEPGPEWTCADCGNHDGKRITWHRSGGYFEPPEYDPECLECGSDKIEEGPFEALGESIRQRDDLAEQVEALQAEIADLKGLNGIG
jgi:hypothetical protein